MPVQVQVEKEIDGEPREVEVEVDDETITEAGYVPESEVDQRFDEKFSEELEKRTRNAKKGLVDPEDLSPEELRELRPDLAQEFRESDGEIPEDRLEEYRSSWERKHLKPVREEKESLEEENSRLREGRVDLDISRAFSGEEVVDDPGMRKLIRDHYRGRVSYSPEHDATFVLNEEGEPIPAEEGDTPYLTVSEDLSLKREDSDEYGSWFGSQARGGGGYEGSEGTEPGRFAGVKYKSDLQGDTDRESRENRVAYIAEHGYDAWASLPAERPAEDEAA